MTEAQNKSDATWTPIPFGNVLSGHLMTGVIGGGLTLVLMWAASAIGLVGQQDFDGILYGAVVVYLVMQVLSAVVMRRFSIRAEHDDPGSVSMAVILYALSVLAGASGGAVVDVSDPNWVLMGSAASLIGNGIYLTFLDEPWKDGMTRGEFREKWDATKKMTKEVFSDETDDTTSESRRDREE